MANLNGEGFDIPATLQGAPRHLKPYFKRTFGSDPSEQNRLSPVNHLAPPNAPAFLFMAAEDESRLLRQSEDAAKRFRSAGPNARFERLPEFRRGVLSTYLLAEEGGAGQPLRTFFKSEAASRSERPARP